MAEGIPGDFWLTVTAEDIREGVPGSGLDCPINRAMRRRGIEARTGYLHVHADGAVWQQSSMEEEDGRTFAQCFDEGVKVYPQSILLRRMPEEG